MTALSPLQVAQRVLPYLLEDGKLTPFRAAAQVYSTVDVRTNLTPPVKLDVARLEEPGEPSLLAKVVMRMVRPTVRLSGPMGEKVLAPAGEAHAHGALVGVALVAGVLGAAFGLGYVVARATG